MRIKLFKKQAIAKMLTLLGFSSAAFVFAACYGTMPTNYRGEAEADSVLTEFTAEADSLQAVEATDSIE